MTDSAAGRKREKVAVLGGGVAGLTAALELSATPELRDRYDVTIYQLGWRCGGKCATGRDPATLRIQEHGLHLWFGGYDNAFKLLAGCYEELNRPEEHPIATMDQAWHPLSSVVLYDHYKGKWSDNPTRFLLLPGTPWEDELSLASGSSGTSRCRRCSRRSARSRSSGGSATRSACGSPVGAGCRLPRVVPAARVMRSKGSSAT